MEYLEGATLKETHRRASRFGHGHGADARHRNRRRAGCGAQRRHHSPRHQARQHLHQPTRPRQDPGLRTGQDGKPDRARRRFTDADRPPRRKAAWSSGRRPTWRPNRLAARWSITAPTSGRWVLCSMRWRRERVRWRPSGSASRSRPSWSASSRNVWRQTASSATSSASDIRTDLQRLKRDSGSAQAPGLTATRPTRWKMVLAAASQRC